MYTGSLEISAAREAQQDTHYHKNVPHTFTHYYKNTHKFGTIYGKSVKIGTYRYFPPLETENI